MFSYVCYCCFVVALVDKDFASLKNKKLKLHDNKDLGDNSHHLPVPMSCHDDPKDTYMHSTNPKSDQNLSYFLYHCQIIKPN
jgi:hypothetical protein